MAAALTAAERTITALLVLAGVLSSAACSESKSRLDHECDVVFTSRVTSAVGQCTGPFKPVVVYAVTCPKRGPRLMLAKTWHGDDYAWGRAGSQWHILANGETVAAPMQACIGDHA